MRKTTPVWSAWAVGRHDRRGVFVCGQQLNAPTTPTAEGECFGRLVPGATVHRGQCVLQTRVCQRQQTTATRWRQRRRENES